MQEHEYATALELKRQNQEDTKIKRMRLLAEKQAEKQLMRLMENPLALTHAQLESEQSTTATTAIKVEQQGPEVIPLSSDVCVCVSPSCVLR